MLEQSTGKLVLPDRPRAVALLILAGISGSVVWTFHHAAWTGLIAALMIGLFIGFLAGGLVGVHLFPSLAAMAAFGGIFEGMVQGWSRFGMIGLIFGGIVGFIITCIALMLPAMLVHFVMIVCGHDPFANSASMTDEKHSES